VPVSGGSLNNSFAHAVATQRSKITALLNYLSRGLTRPAFADFPSSNAAITSLQTLRVSFPSDVPLTASATGRTSLHSSGIAMGTQHLKYNRQLSCNRAKAAAEYFGCISGLGSSGNVIWNESTMSGELTRRLKPEEEELLNKRQELTAIRVLLAEGELELAELRRELIAFEGRYLRQVGVLYAELDEWKARIAELRAIADQSAAGNASAEEAREQARQTFEAAHGAASQAPDFEPLPDLKRLFREAARRIHPDFARDSTDRERRTRFMADANRAYESGDSEALERILDEYQDGADSVEGEGIGAELIRIIRQIRQAKDRIAAIGKQLAALQESEIALLKKDAEERTQAGGDLLSELAAAVREQVEGVKKEYEILSAFKRKTA